MVEEHGAAKEHTWMGLKAEDVQARSSTASEEPGTSETPHKKTPRPLLKGQPSYESAESLLLSSSDGSDLSFAQ